MDNRRTRVTRLLGSVLLLAAGGLVSHWLAPRPAAAQGEAARYSVAVSGGRAYFVDGATGRLWLGIHPDERKSEIRWEPVSSPIRPFPSAK